MMLSSSSSHRLLSLLNQAIHKCKEEERQLEDQLRQYRKLLNDWKTDSSEALEQGETRDEPQEIQPSPAEVEEVLLLNKALEKALKVRGSRTTESLNTPPITQPIPVNEVPVKPIQKLVSTGTKTKSYQLKPPYKTMPEKVRGRGSSRPTSTASTTRAPNLRPPTSEKVQNRAASSTNTAGATALRLPTSGKDNAGKDRLASSASTTKPTSFISPTSEKGKDNLVESKEVPPGTVITLGDLRPLVAPGKEYDGTAKTIDMKSSKQDQMRSQKALTLKDIGSSLKLPIQFQQLYRKNSRLWEKFYETRPRVPASRPSFIQQLQTTFIQGSPERSLSEIEEDTARLQRTARHLEEYIDTARTWQGSGPSHWQHYRTLLMLDAVQDEVAKSRCELQKLELAADQYKKWCEKLLINTDCSEVTDCLSELCSLPPVLVYSHPDELQNLTTTHLRVRELQQKIYLQKVLSKELLAEAHLQCQSSSPSYVLLRAIYTELCEGGDIFPVLVHDDG